MKIWFLYSNFTHLNNEVFKDFAQCVEEWDIHCSFVETTNLVGLNVKALPMLEIYNSFFIVQGNCVFWLVQCTLEHEWNTTFQSARISLQYSFVTLFQVKNMHIVLYHCYLLHRNWPRYILNQDVKSFKKYSISAIVSAFLVYVSLITCFLVSSNEVHVVRVSRSLYLCSLY